MIRQLTLLISPLLLCVPAAASSAPCWIQDAASVGDSVWLLCDRDRIYASSDAGGEWRASKLPSDMRLRAIEFLDSRRGFIAGDNGALLSSADGGETWSPVAVPTRENLRDIHFVGEKGWIAGHAGAVLHSEDGGRNWAAQLTSITLALEGIFFADENHGWAVGWNGVIIRTTDGGKKWGEVRSEAAQWSFSSVYFRDARNGWAVGFFGQLLHTRDGGLTWESQPVPTRALLNSVVFDRSGRGWITARDDVLVSDDAGRNWRAVGLTGGLFLEKIVPVKDSVWAVGPFGVLRQRPGTGAWENLAGLPRAGAS